MKVILPILPKIGCHGNGPWGIGKEVQIYHIHANPYNFVGGKIVKIGPVKPEKKISEGKIYSPVSKFTEQAK